MARAKRARSWLSLAGATGGAGRPRAQHHPADTAPDTGTDAAQPGGSPMTIGWSEFADWAGRHRVVLSGLGLIAAQLVWKAFFLGHFFYWQEDFHYLDRALSSGFSWNYLAYPGTGHLIPGPYAIAWILARVSLYDWPLASAVTLVMLAAASLAALRLLRTLFGDRPAILIPLTVYLLTPLTLPDLGYWSSAIESLPLQLATFMALHAHVCYLRTGRLRQAGVAAGWLALGLIFFEKGIVLPLLLFAVTSAFFVDGRWLAAARRALISFWRAWVIYAAVLVAYLVVLVLQLQTATVGPGLPGSYRNALVFMSDLVRDTLLPGAVGGPWQWFPSGALAYSAPPGGLLWLSWIVSAGIVAASIWSREHAWRAWLILGGWVFAADMVPVLLGRVRQLNGALLGVETRYVADAAPVLVICLGLAFWPVVGQRDSRRTRHMQEVSGQVVTAATAGVIGAFVIGSLWSVQAYENATTSAPARVYIADARAALAAAPRGTVIVDQQVPASVVEGILGRYSYTSVVAGAMARGKPPGQLRWIRHPAGTFDHLMALGPDGRLVQAVVVGVASSPMSAGQACWPPSRVGRIVIPLRSVAVNPGLLRIGYAAVAAYPVTVSFAGQLQAFNLLPGVHSGYLLVKGSASRIIVTGAGAFGQLCIGDAEAGQLLPSGSGPAIPAVPEPG
jgi:hypothetical protein